MAPDSPRAITIAILAMGGEGGGVLAERIVDLAEHEGYWAQMTSVPGVAQRTGATIYYVELFPAAAIRAAGKEPILALSPTPGDVDIVIASELMEAGRAIQRGLVTPDRTTLIASTHRAYSIAEKIAPGDGRVNAEKLLEAGKVAAMRFIHADFARIAADESTVITAVLFGALAASGTLPFTRAQYEAAIQRGDVGAHSGVAAMAAGFAAVEGPARLPDAAPAMPLPSGELAARIAAAFPESAHPTLLHGVRRLVDYQDAAYANEYLDRLLPVVEVDRARGDGTHRLVIETARHLALWMSYEDVIRVADLKTRRSRFQRVGSELQTDSSEVYAINEFMHPRVQEIADTLPAALGAWLLNAGPPRRFVERRCARGRIVTTSSIGGFVLLYLISGLRRFRRGTLRYRNEHARIAAWIEQVRASAAHDCELAVEVAKCARLVKGYGDTHERGTRNFLAVMRALPALSAAGNAALRVREMREAALADEHWTPPDEELSPA